LFKVEVHCFILMRNHFHFLLTTRLANLSRFMQRLNTAYTVYFNKRHDRVGHLFQGRYKAILIDVESYLLELSRYIHLNPVRTDFFSNKTIREKIQYLETYEWSSYRRYLGKASRWNFVHTEMVLNMIGKGGARAYEEYKEFVIDGLRGEVTDPLERKDGQVVAGNPEFVKWVFSTFIEGRGRNREYTRIRKSLPPFTIDQLIRAVSTEFDADPREILRSRSKHRRAREVLIELCCRYLLKDLSLREIGEQLGGITVSGLGASRERLKRRMKKDSQLKQSLDRIKATLFS
jgi:putative transposase